MLEQLKEDHLLWYLNRGSGVVLVGVLTLATVVGVLATSRAASPRWPRFATQSLHRSLSLLSVTLLAVHVVTAVVDTYVSGFVEITPLHAVVPFTSSYQRLWLGIGVLALDLLAAVVVTSLLRHRFTHTTWRRVHLLSYVAWALGVTHGYFIGTDARTSWALGVTVVSVGAVLVAVLVRLRTLAHERAREYV